MSPNERSGTMNYHPDLPQTGYVTRERAKQYFSISNSTLHSWQNKGYFPKSVRVGPRAVRFNVSDLRAFEAKLLARDGAVTG
jgi:predicted DNA-binding transcriptional regulator AlpA